VVTRRAHTREQASEQASELASWRAGELASWRAGELASWRAGKLARRTKRAQKAAPASSQANKKGFKLHKSDNEHWGPIVQERNPFALLCSSGAWRHYLALAQLLIPIFVLAPHSPPLSAREERGHFEAGTVLSSPQCLSPFERPRLRPSRLARAALATRAASRWRPMGNIYCPSRVPRAPSAARAARAARALAPSAIPASWAALPALPPSSRSHQQHAAATTTTTINNYQQCAQARGCSSALRACVLASL